MQRSCAVITTALLVLASCKSQKPYGRDETDAALFGPSAMRIHPIFTQVTDWTGDGRPDGIEALVELQDQFGDPTKASGRLVFELYEYRPYNADPRGERLAFWNGQLVSAQDQSDRWNRTSRTYSFPLSFDRIRADSAYVLAATFERAEGGRFFDRIVMEPREPAPTPAPASPATSPAGAGPFGPGGAR